MDATAKACAANILPDPAHSRLAVLACATVIEEMQPLLPAGVQSQTLDFGLHVRPETLKNALQEAVHAWEADVDAIVLGYGLCSMGVVGLASRSCYLVVPRVHDCIGIFLGSGVAYQQQASAEPGTYYLTKGWIEAGDGPFGEYEQWVERYGPERAEWLIQEMLKNYTRLALIDTGKCGMDHYRSYAQRTADRFGLRFEEIPGSSALVRKLLHGPWDEECIVVPPGRAITLGDFLDGVQ